MCDELENLGSTYIVENSLKIIKRYIEENDELRKNINRSILLDNSIDFDNVKKDVKALYDKYFELRNIVYYPKKISRFYFIKKRQIEEIKNKPLVNPFDIPITEIKYNDNNTNLGMTFLRKINIPGVESNLLVNHICINKNNLSREIYSHEIAHTQYNNSYNSISYLDDEVISIFLERLAQDEFNSKNMLYLRLQHLCKGILFLEENKYTDDEVKIYQKIEFLKYIESTLKAYLLYSKLKNESLSSTRNRIIDDINDVFSKKITVQELLSKHDITRDNCKSLSLFKQTI